METSSESTCVYTVDVTVGVRNVGYKRLEFNKHLLCTFIDKLDLDRDLILNHPNLPSVLSYGTLAA